MLAISGLCGYCHKNATLHVARWQKITSIFCLLFFALLLLLQDYKLYKFTAVPFKLIEIEQVRRIIKWDDG